MPFMFISENNLFLESSIYVFLDMITAENCFSQVAYMLLQRVSPVTHSVANCVKRVVVIVSSVIFFRTPVSPVNGLGITELLRLRSTGK